jgi:hypothetical protein
MGSALDGLLPKSISCFDKPVLSELFTLREPQGERRVEGLSMSGKLKCFQHFTVRPEPVEGQTVGLGNSPLTLDKSISKIPLNI